MLYPIGKRLNQAIAEKIEKDLKEAYPGKVERVKMIENADGFFIKIIGSISDSEIESFMKNLFNTEEIEMDVKDVKKKDEVGGLDNIVGGLLGTALQAQITKATDEAIKKPVEEASQKLDQAVSDFNEKAEQKLKDLDSTLEKKLNDINARVDNLEKREDKQEQKLKKSGQKLCDAAQSLTDAAKSLTEE